MAEFGKITDISKNESNPQWLKLVAEFLINSSKQEVFNRLENGTTEKVEIDGDNIFAVYQKYDSKEGSEPVFEVHQKYIDVQYVHSGRENILVAGSEGAHVIQPYEEDNDCELSLLKEWSSLRMEAGMASILYPEDLHAPGIRIDKAEQVEKIVVKVRID